MSTAVAEPKIEVTDISSLSEKTVFLKVRTGMIGNSKKVKQDVLTTDADKTLVKVSKTLLDSPELTAIRSGDQNIRIWLGKVCLPFDSGVLLLPINAIPNVNQKLTDYKKERQELVDAFLDVYPALRDKAKQQLGSLFNLDDYPNPDKVKGKFAFEFNYITFEVPEKLKEISPELFYAESDKAAKQLKVAVDEIAVFMRQNLLKLTEHLSDRLVPGDDGKPKKLHQSAITNLKEFLETFDLRNVVNDQQLSEQVKKVSALIEGVTADKLRESDTFRAEIQAQMEAVTKTLGTLVEEVPGRKFAVEEYE